MFHFLIEKRSANGNRTEQISSNLVRDYSLTETLRSSEDFGVSGAAKLLPLREKSPESWKPRAGVTLKLGHFEMSFTISFTASFSVSLKE